MIEIGRAIVAFGQIEGRLYCLRPPHQHLQAEKMWCVHLVEAAEEIDGDHNGKMLVCEGLRPIPVCFLM